MNSLSERSMRNWMRQAKLKISNFLPFFEEREELLREMRLQKGPWLLHVSDTPTSFYRPLKQLVSLLAPEIIVHTGDLADEVKIGICRRDLPLYIRRVRILAAFLDSPRTYIVLGNHDNLEELRRVFPRSTLFPESALLRRKGVSMGLSHRAEDLPREKADFYLYGHDDSPPPEGLEAISHNGLEKFGCYNLCTREWRFFEYPRYVRDARSRKFKMGL